MGNRIFNVQPNKKMYFLGNEISWAMQIQGKLYFPTSTKRPLIIIGNVVMKCGSCVANLCFKIEAHYCDVRMWLLICYYRSFVEYCEVVVKTCMWFKKKEKRKQVQDVNFFVLRTNQDLIL